uniref:Uncharacterized protein n=1 Tax=Anopheles arabiensis TaxID=7173 RepID=A0A182IFQ4_ANOAR
MCVCDACGFSIFPCSAACGACCTVKRKRRTDSSRLSFGMVWCSRNGIVRKNGHMELSREAMLSRPCVRLSAWCVSRGCVMQQFNVSNNGIKVNQ